MISSSNNSYIFIYIKCYFLLFIFIRIILTNFQKNISVLIIKLKHASRFITIKALINLWDPNMIWYFKTLTTGNRFPSKVRFQSVVQNKVKSKGILTMFMSTPLYRFNFQLLLLLICQTFKIITGWPYIVLPFFVKILSLWEFKTWNFEMLELKFWKFGVSYIFWNVWNL